MSRECDHIPEYIDKFKKFTCTYASVRLARIIRYEEAIMKRWKTIDAKQRTDGIRERDTQLSYLPISCIAAICVLFSNSPNWMKSKCIFKRILIDIRHIYCTRFI